MITSAIPVIAVSDSARAEDYYCSVLGFEKMFAYAPDVAKTDPRYLGVSRDGVWFHLQNFMKKALMILIFLCISVNDGKEYYWPATNNCGSVSFVKKHRREGKIYDFQRHHFQNENLFLAFVI